ncbi:hypothetical protein CGCSCA5_v012335 [Colletotrichum siamense]|nr:hypothetical protein CGCSCA5_v012335 [Colletotrichum siamense]KAF4868131.1 hypothetical protein CGCSCA1_v012739 [Colletotrichum siamense]
MAAAPLVRSAYLALDVLMSAVRIVVLCAAHDRALVKGTLPESLPSFFPFLASCSLRALAFASFCQMI